jgi:L-amino acid N-acyltransferase YncA
LKFLIDTNIFIPLEPRSSSDLEALTKTTARLARLANEFGHSLYIHPAASFDVDRDGDQGRKKLRRIQLEKYPALPDPPEVSTQLEAILGRTSLGTNDWVDNQLIAAVAADSVDFLISEDVRIHKKARKLDFTDRVLTVTEAISLLLDLSEKVPSSPPAVLAVKAHAINSEDPILNGFRKDYLNFDQWLRKCKRQHRQAWIIKSDEEKLAALCIINHEKTPPGGLNGKVLKLCSFKVSDSHNGFRFGELMLKAVLDHAFENCYEWIFVTVFEKYSKLIELFEDFGFSKLDKKTNLGEIVLAKPLNPQIDDSKIKDSLVYHIRYGPRFFKTEGVSWYVVPIKHRYAQVLFTEAESQTPLFAGLYPSGNAIRKAYLCNSRVRSIIPGSILVFYRTEEYRGGIAIGVVEKTFVSSSSDDIVKIVSKRTVYSLEEIKTLCKHPVLVILFRQAQIFSPPISLNRLVNGAVFVRPPQSIKKLKEEGKQWLQEVVAM